MEDLKVIICTNKECPFCSSCMTFLASDKEAIRKELPTPKHKYVCPYYSSIHKNEVLKRLDDYEEE